MAAEFLSLVYAFDLSFCTADMLSEIWGRKVEIDGYNDSKTVFDTVRLNPTPERLLLIDVSALQESHQSGDL